MPFEREDDTPEDLPTPLPFGTLLGVAALVSAVSCGYQPGHAPVEWHLAEATLQKLEEGNAVPSAAARTPWRFWQSSGPDSGSVLGRCCRPKCKSGNE